MSKVLDIAMMGTKVYVRSRDHCPPLVHVIHAGEGGSAATIIPVIALARRAARQNARTRMVERNTSN